ncbi:shikimate dehydrogenase (NADP(+)) [Dissulfurispira thermophila]|uniref:Shikimate dehydrogenase (NADP(+)) n=1 Tax=Dissulfurispira thermophila TaxID=2715679 RepID=A0A7G1H4B4_9BACT|nr:shikimate dehydrogenase [Dissulfurispira thermophila]BCB96963.1 shikimate dehydrogenase (NADP(+)) [Dissulfurispira thermophila]
MNISGKTRVTGLFGYPVEHSLSPLMHNAAFKYLGLDYCYVTFLVSPDLLGDAVKAIKALNLSGVNVTVPHKENVINFLDEISEEASFIGAVNTIKNDNGKLIGYNTDGRGFMRSLTESNIDVRGKKILILGSGGASRAIGYYLCKEAKEVYLFDIDNKKAVLLRDHLNRLKGNVLLADIESVRNKDFFSDIGVIINATPLGLKPDDPVPVDISVINKNHIVCDLIYKETPLLKNASMIGCKTMDGLGMLLYQGVFAFEIWTGVIPPVDVMRQAIGKR